MMDSSAGSGVRFRPRPWRLCRALTILLATGAFVGCEGNLFAFNPAGPQAQRISDLGWLMIALGSAVYLVVIGFLFHALRRGSRREVNAAGPAAERKMTRWVIGAVGATVAILLFVLVFSLHTGRAIGTFGDESSLTIRVVGHQWWWQVIYEDPQPHRTVTTANEIRIPVGRKVRVIGESRDVIHSFWPPNLHGKIDLIPGYRNTTYLQADRAGVFRGRCAEFCGLQHARMEFLVIAMDHDQFAAWYERELLPAPEPTDTLQQRGQDIFLTRGCVLCHTVRGTPAGSRFGPDLTHLASRRTLGGSPSEQPGESGRVGIGSAGDQARRSHAADAAGSRRAQCPVELPGEPQVKVRACDTR